MSARTRIGLAVMALAACVTSTSAAPKCAVPGTDIAVCAGTSGSGTASYCFGAGCGGAGTIVGFQPPDAPFAVTRVHVEGPFGSRAIGGGDYPVLILPGEQMVLDVSVVVDAPGQRTSQIVWY